MLRWHLYSSFSVNFWLWRILTIKQRPDPRSQGRRLRTSNPPHFVKFSWKLQARGIIPFPPLSSGLPLEGIVGNWQRCLESYTRWTPIETPFQYCSSQSEPRHLEIPSFTIITLTVFCQSIQSKLVMILSIVCWPNSELFLMCKGRCIQVIGIDQLKHSLAFLNESIIIFIGMDEKCPEKACESMEIKKFWYRWLRTVVAELGYPEGTTKRSHFVFVCLPLIHFSSYVRDAGV